MKKLTFLPNFHIFCTILTFLHQNWYWQKHLSLCLKVCMTLLRNSIICPKTDAFCDQKLTLFKNRKHSFKNTWYLHLKLKYLKTVTIGYKNEKNSSKLVFLQDFRFYQWSTHNEKINTSKKIVIFYRIENQLSFLPKLTTKLIPFSKNWSISPKNLYLV